MKLRWTKETTGEVAFQPPCPKEGLPKRDQRGFWSAQSAATEKRFVIEPVYSNSAKKPWLHIIHYTLSDGVDQIHFKGRTVKDCKASAQKIESEIDA